jgi:hypothetical protein
MDEDDDRVPFAWGDIGALILAAGVAVCTLWLIGDMLIGGHPLGVLFATGQKPAASAGPTPEEIRATPMHLDSGEVRINMTPAKPKKPPPKPKN